MNGRFCEFFQAGGTLGQRMLGMASTASVSVCISCWGVAAVNVLCFVSDQACEKENQHRAICTLCKMLQVVRDSLEQVGCLCGD